MSRWILIALILLTVAGLRPTPVSATEVQAIENCWDGERLRPVPGRWYKVASRTEDDWFGVGDPILNLTPEPGMPQALGFASWQALYDDIVSVDGQVEEIGLHYVRTPNNNPRGTYMARHPADPRLLPEGQPSSADPSEWIYFMWDVPQFPASPNLAYVRVQHENGPLMMLDFGVDAGWDWTFSLWVKM